MEGVLVDVFDISGRGCVVLVDVASGSCRMGDTLSIGPTSYAISGIEMINHNAEGLARIAAGWRPPLGLLVRGADKGVLIDLIGQKVICTESIAI